MLLLGNYSLMEQHFTLKIKKGENFLMTHKMLSKKVMPSMMVNYFVMMTLAISIMEWPGKLLDYQNLYCKLVQA